MLQIFVQRHAKGFNDLPFIRTAKNALPRPTSNTILAHIHKHVNVRTTYHNTSI